MLEEIASAFDKALGLQLESQDLNSGHMALRAFIVFVLAVAMIRLGDKRFMGKSTALDVMLGIAFGSLMSRAITGNSAFVPTLVAGLTLVLVHWVFATITFHSHVFGNAVKGHHQVLVKGGVLQDEAMRGSHITKHDLEEALRSHGKPSDLSLIKDAHLERDGSISIISR